MTEPFLEIAPEYEDRFSDLRCIKIDSNNLRDPMELVPILGIPDFSTAKLARALTEKHLEIPLGSYIFAWRGSTRSLSGITVEGMKIGGTKHGYVTTESGDYIGEYKRVIDESEGLGYSDEESEIRRNALHCLIVTPIMGT